MLGITGATGQLGRLVLEQLPQTSATQQVRLLARNPTKASQVWSPPAGITTEIKAVTYSHTDETVSALRGCDVVFMVSGSEDVDRLKQHFAFVDACQAAGVSQIVYTSFYGASHTAEFRLARDHAKTEEYISERLPKSTFLRNNLYADVLHYFGPKIEGPAGSGYFTPVARVDLARATATILGDPSKHEGKTYNFTGSGRVNLAEVAQILNDAARSAGKNEVATFSYTNQTWDEAFESRKKAYDVPDWLITAWTSTYSAIKLGEMDGVSPDIEKITGQKPLTFSEFANKVWAPQL